MVQNVMTYEEKYIRRTETQDTPQSRDEKRRMTLRIEYTGEKKTKRGVEHNSACDFTYGPNTAGRTTCAFEAVYLVYLHAASQPSCEAATNQVEFFWRVIY